MTPPNLRQLDDIPGMRKGIYDRVLNSVSKKYPIENERYRLELGDLSYDHGDTSLEAQKQAVLAGKTLHSKLYGTWKLTDKATGQPVDTVKSVVAHVPHLTDRGTFVINGTEQAVINQMRLRPGVYTRQKENGELEAHFNIMPGSGQAFRVHMEPATGVFKLQIDQSHVPLYPVLKGMGVTDEQMGKWWGKKLLEVNQAKATDAQALPKVYERMVTKPVQGENVGQALSKRFGEMGLDPDVVSRHLGNYLEPDKLGEPKPPIEQPKAAAASGAGEEEDILDYIERLELEEMQAEEAQEKQAEEDPMVAFMQKFLKG